MLFIKFCALTSKGTSDSVVSLARSMKAAMRPLIVWGLGSTSWTMPVYEQQVYVTT
jgi:hypothetical protein